MARRPIRVVLVGYGSANRAVMELILQRRWLDVVGIVVQSAERDGEPAALRVPGAPADLRCSTDLAGTLAEARPDVAIVATHTKLADVLPILEVLAASGTPIVCTAEDLAFIEAADSAEAARILELAVTHGIPIVANGANPGFVLDLWPLTLSGLAWDVERLRARRIVDVSVFGPRVRASLGIDLTPDAFQAGIADGSVVGHAGFPESLRILAAGMGRTLERIEVVSDPILADRALTLPDGSVVREGRTAGANQRATGWFGGQPWLEISMTLHVDPPVAGLAPTDRIELEGRHGLTVTVDPGCRALLSTAAMLVNGLPRAVAASPGVYRPGDLPPSGPWLGDEPPPWVPLRDRGDGPTITRASEVTPLEVTPLDATPLAGAGDPAPWAMTVGGPVPTADLGRVLPHEHLLIDLREVAFQEPDDERGRVLARRPITLETLGWVRRHWTSSLDNLHQLDEELATRELAAFVAAGGGTVVDCTVPGIGRDPLALQRMSVATGVHVVMGAGSYVEPTHPAEVRALDIDGLAERVVAEWRDGADGTGIRPGLIGETGCSWPLHPRERAALQAMAAAQRVTGLPMMIHPGRDPRAVGEILSIVTAAGLDLGRLILAHLDRGITPHEELVELARAGVYVELDCFGLESALFPPNARMATLSDAQRLDIVRGLLDAGVGDRVLLAHDVCQKHRLTAYGGHGFGHLTGEILPWMLKRGFTQEEVTGLFITNPARALAVGAP